jgi:hypothetical protein
MVIGTGVEGAVSLLPPSTPAPEVIKSEVIPGVIGKNGGGNRIRFFIDPDTAAFLL